MMQHKNFKELNQWALVNLGTTIKNNNSLTLKCNKQPYDVTQKIASY